MTSERVFLVDGDLVIAERDLGLARVAARVGYLVAGFGFRYGRCAGVPKEVAHTGLI